MNKISNFRGKYAFLSNFYESPFIFDGIWYQNSEAAFQAQKCANPKDRESFSILDPSSAKKLGRKVKLRDGWEEIKYDVMKSVVRTKFNRNPILKEMLINTGDAYLEEGNTWGDKTWGVYRGEGKNLLGQILMEVRQEFASV